MTNCARFTSAARPTKRLAVLLVAGFIAGCSPVVETDQARLCRMALPALIPGGRAEILAESPDPDGRGLALTFSVRTSGAEAPERHTVQCRFREPGRPRESRDLAELAVDGRRLSEGRLFALHRYWLATPEGRA